MAAWQQAVNRDELALTLFEESGDALFLFDPESEAVIDVNPMAERLSGYPYAELLPLKITYLFRSLTQGGLNRLRTAFKRTGHFQAQEDFLLRNKQDGVWTPVNVAVSRLHTRARTLGLITARDVSERRRLEAKNTRLAALVRSSDHAIVAESLDGLVTDWNAGAERLYGYTAEEIIGRKSAALVAPGNEGRFQSVLDRLRRGEPVPPAEELGRRKDGKLVPVSVSRSPIRDANGKVVGAAAFHRDVSDRLRLEEELRQAQKMEAIGQLAGGVAHDFNNLLTIINGCSELLLDRSDFDPAALALVAQIHKAGERSAALTAQLLAFSRRQVLEPKVIDLNERVRGLEQMLSRTLGEDVTLTTCLAADLGQVKADPGQIDQVILNLAVNARDAMPRGGTLTIRTAAAELDEVYVQGHPDVWPGRYVLLEVRDSGTGMDPATRAHIFEPFFTTKGPGKGTGLGLAVVHGVIAQSGGHITVSSQLGHGTTFQIYLPQVEGLKHAPKSDHGEEAPVPCGNETVLLVEDEEGVRQLARDALQMAGYTVLEAAHGGDGLRVAEQHEGPIHLLVSDVVMPGVGGRMLADRLAEARPGTKVLFLSGYMDDAVVRHGILGSDINFLQKPFTPTALVRKVREVLEA